MHKITVISGLFVTSVLSHASIVYSQTPIDQAAEQASADQGAASGGLAEIIVTAQKRAENLQDTPISIAAFDSAAIEARRITSLTDVASAVPNLKLSPHTNSQTSVIAMIRGVGQLDNQMTRDPPVAIYADGVYLGRVQGMGVELANLERIEVLRGPQGTLYGRNATAGAINFISRAPKLGELGFEQKLTVGNFNEFRSRSSLNIPVGDTLAFELTYLRAKKDGFIRNIGSGEPWFGNVDRNAIRAAAFWKLNDVFEARYTYDTTWIDDTSHFIAAIPVSPIKARRPKTGSPFVRDLQPNDTRIQGHNLTLNYDVADNLTLKSISGYRKMNSFVYQDYHTGVQGPFSLIVNNGTENQKQFSEELQAIGDAVDGRLKYVAGLYYFHESGNGFNSSTFPTRTSVSDFDFKNSAYAVFGQATFTPALLDERLHLTVGARWSKDKRAASAIAISTPNGGPAVTQNYGNYRKSFNDFSPSGTLQFDVSNDVNVYAKIAKGYKGGGTSVTASSAATFARGFGPETLLSYEAGIKSELFDRRIRFNAAAYYNDYKDIQLNIFDPNNPRLLDIINAGKAVTKGFEIDVNALLAKGLSVSGSYGFVDAKYKEVLDLAGNDLTDRFVFPQAPRNSFTLSADYKSPETPIGTFDANVSYNWQDTFFGMAGTRRYVVGANGLLNGMIGLSDVGGCEGLRVALWARNLINETYLTSYTNSLGDSGVFGEPRTYGVDITIKL